MKCESKWKYNHNHNGNDYGYIDYHYIINYILIYISLNYNVEY